MMSQQIVPLDDILGGIAYGLVFLLLLCGTAKLVTWVLDRADGLYACADCGQKTSSIYESDKRRCRDCHYRAVNAGWPPSQPPRRSPHCSSSSSRFLIGWANFGIYAILALHAAAAGLYGFMAAALGMAALALFLLREAT